MDVHGNLLKRGIAAVVVAKDEATIIPYALKSLLDFADQVICIDNGSTDDTLELMKAFKKNHEDDIEVDVVSMPNALLGDCRQAGLDHTKYIWHLRWDADMVFKTSGPDSCQKLREKTLRNDRPRAIQLPRTNLFGDLQHTSKLYKVVDPGEPILVKFCKDIEYREYGKFDTIKLPRYYITEQEFKRYYFHCNGLKSDLRLIYRNCYFDWRELVNKVPRSSQISFEDFKEKWTLDRYGTTDANALKYRYQKELMLHLERYDSFKYGYYPKILSDVIDSGKERFKVEYENGRPLRRVDRREEVFKGYKPTEEDQNFDPMTMLERVLPAPKVEKLKNK